MTDPLIALFALNQCAQLLESAMLVCFGIGWPIDVIKTLRTRHIEGKSIGFMTMIFAGYLAGMGSKFARWADTGLLEKVTALYAFNAVMVGIDILLYIHYRRIGSAAPSPDAS